MKRILFTLSFLLAVFYLQCQITITESDMPNVGDTIRVSNGISGSVGPNVPTGTDTTWDYTSLTPVDQNVIEFIDIVNMPIPYQTVFNNPLDPEHKADYATPQGDSLNIPNMQLSDPYTFYQKTNNSFGIIGYGLKLNGFPVPSNYDSLDLFYSFPLNYGDQFSSHSVSSNTITGLGYVEREIKRENFVDGWGTLKTPYGTFDVLRVRSEVLQRDSINFDSLPAFPAITTNKTVYKFIGKNKGIPLLTIEEQNGLTANVTYIDSVRNITSSASEQSQADFELYPNPFHEVLKLNWNKDFHLLKIYTATGHLIHRENIENQKHYRINSNIWPKTGLFIIEMQGEDIISRQKVVKTK